MKATIFAASAACLTMFAMSGAPALADVSKEVRIPVELKTDAQVTAYTDDLLQAVESVCWRTHSPMMAGDYDTYRACMKTTAVATAAKDPTGLLAARLGQTPATLAVAAR